MIDLFYEDRNECYGIVLYELNNGKAKQIATFSDREDLLFYIEKNYKLARLIVKGE